MREPGERGFRRRIPLAPYLVWGLLGVGACAGETADETDRVVEGLTAPSRDAGPSAVPSPHPEVRAPETVRGSLPLQIEWQGAPNDGRTSALVVVVWNTTSAARAAEVVVTASSPTGEMRRVSVWSGEVSPAEPEHITLPVEDVPVQTEGMASPNLTFPRSV